MKIKEVCKKTGLTDRAIRFYIEKGLLTTDARLVNGRINRDYTKDDILLLQDISTLRKAGFSIQDILDMQNSARDINDIIEAHYLKLEKEADTLKATAQRLQEINARGAMPWRKIPYEEAEELNLLEDDFIRVEAVFSNAEFIRDYCTVVRISTGIQ